ncbi:MAG TPA: ATP-binding cassette domain-containing protein [Chthoniobacteraceae bacterium]|nr:ATP-binding cassette domain-containing protein [Chthoniobacteraceae bacterium]
MLELEELSLQVPQGGEEVILLSEISAHFPNRHFAAVVGPSGCGKSTLLKTIAGLREATAGHVRWDRIDLAEEDMDPHEIGYVPQFSIAYELLTARESIQIALGLRMRDNAGESNEARVTRILSDVGLEDIADRRVQLLSGGQRRRLALALEIVSSPHLLLCDEATSGLDPKAEDEIVRLMHQLSRSHDRIVLSVTHSLRHLGLYDSVLVLDRGHLAYHGPPETLLHYFNVELPDELFARLSARKPDEWHSSWQKHRAAYEKLIEPEEPEENPGASEPVNAGVDSTDPQALTAPADAASPAAATVQEKQRTPATPQTPSALTQLGILLRRRATLFFRDRGQLVLQVALLLGFPCLVVVFALDGLPTLKSLAQDPTKNFWLQLAADAAQRTEQVRIGSLVSGLIMFQVILLALMGCNNAAREIAGERLIFEKEKFAGLRPIAYVASKAIFLCGIVLAQSLWMGVFVNAIVRFPGDLVTQLLLLILVNGALAAVCLAISSMMRNTEQASLTSIYLVGFQLPLSGAVLALPTALNAFTRPFIASYWGWSGFIQTVRETRFYDAIQLVSQTRLAPASLCVWALGIHIVVGLLVAYIGCKSSRWD